MTVEEWLGKDNTLGVDIWKGKYQFEGETFDHWLDRVSGGDDEVRDLIIKKKFLFGGRILANRGTNQNGRKISLSNCYVIAPPEDNIESIFECATKLARTYSYGGGCGIDIGKLAPKGALIHNAAKETSGAVSFMDLYSTVTGLIGQGGRRGALMISIPCDHPDLEEFIKIKQNTDRVTKANISIRVTNEFMQAVAEKKPYTLKFTRESTGEEIVKEIDAHEVFMKMCEANWDWGEPGLLFWDNIENYNLLSEDKNFKYAGVNPCVSGDTLILTSHGYIPIKDLCDKDVLVWNGYQYSQVTPHITGVDMPMYKITFSDGTELRCTHYHKFILKDKNRIEANKLNIGDKIIKCDYPVIDGRITIPTKEAYTQGFFMGDGSIEENRKRKSIKLYGEKRKLIKYINYCNSVYCPSFDGEFLTLDYNDNYNKNNIPDTSFSIQTRLDWLAGYIDSDGNRQGEDGGIAISSINYDVLMKVKRMLNTLGCNGAVSVMRKEGNRLLPVNDGTNNTSIYHCQTSYRLLINASNVKKLVRLGLSTHRVSLDFKPNRDASRFIQVTNIEEDGVCDVVYCFNEPINHSGIFNGIITAQCAEEPLPAGGACLLGSLNLSEFVIENKEFDYYNFECAVRIAVKALNDVLDEGLPLHPLQEQRKSVRNWRQIGLGIFGLADMLIKMGIKYGSPESIELCDKIGYTMAKTAMIESIDEAEEYGHYPKFNADAIAQSSFWRFHDMNTFNANLLADGLRNSQLLTIAPTGTLSTMLRVSGGIEPIFANYYTRKTESLHGHDQYYKVYTPIVKEYMDAHGLTDDSQLPDFFVTAQTLDYKDRIAMQSIWQKHIDASISSTVNVPQEFPVEKVKDIYMEAWKAGLKGITMFRDGCKRAGILTTHVEEDTHEEEPKELKRGMIIKADDNCIGKKRTLQTGCGTLHCEAFFDPDTGDLLETYLSKGSTGGCNNFMVGLSRMISLSARGGVDINSIVDQLKSSGTCPSYAVRTATMHDTSKGSCCPVAIGNALIDMHNEIMSDLMDDYEEDRKSVKISKPIQIVSSNAKCPQCGGNLVFEGGCNTCKDCGWSKCD